MPKLLWKLYPGEVTEVGPTEEEESAVLLSGAENPTADQARLDPDGGDLPDVGPGGLAHAALQVQRTAQLPGCH